MVNLKEGDKLKHRFNGQPYNVEVVKGETVVLTPTGGLPPNRRLWFGAEDVGLFFVTMEGKEVKQLTVERRENR